MSPPECRPAEYLGRLRRGWPMRVKGRSSALVRGAEISDMSGGVLQLLIAQLRRHAVLLGQREQSAEPKRLIEEIHCGIERALPLRDRKRNLIGEARPDVIMGAHAEGVETQRLLALAGYGNHDRGPFDLVRLAASGQAVGVEQYLEMRPGIDPMPSAPVLGHFLLDPRPFHDVPPLPIDISPVPGE